MGDRPMGFGRDEPDDPDDARGAGEGAGGPAEGADPFAGMFAGTDPDALTRALAAAGMGDADPAQVQAMLGQVQRMLATPGDGGPVNWALATDVARQVVSAHGDRSVAAAEHRAVDDALRLADTWLSARTALPAAGARALAWSRAEWVEGTIAVWRRLVEPVAQSVAAALTDAVRRQGPGGLGLPDGLSGILGGTGRGGDASGEQAFGEQALGAMMRQVGGSVFGMQVGQAIGMLSTEIVSGTEIGLPVVPAGAVVLLPAGIAAFGAGLDVPADEVRLYLAVREAARSRLFAHVPWLAPALLGAVEQYAQGIRIDTDRIEEALRQADPSDPASLQEAMANGLFEPQRTAEQQRTLDRLETALALIEGWVEVVTDAAAAALPHAAQLRETVRRRRATAGPAEQTFSALVGLELRPRRLREAAALWHFIGEQQGADARDAVWSHPDLMPTGDDLDDPAGYRERRATAAAGSADVDAAIERMLAGEQPPDLPGSSDSPDSPDSPDQPGPTTDDPR